MWWKTALSWTWRLLLVLPVVAVVWLSLLVDGVAGETLGFLRVAGWLVPVAVVPTWLLFWRRRHRAHVTVAALALALGLGGWLTAMAPMMPSRMAQAVEDLDVPGELVHERRWGTSIWGSRPSLDRTYRTDGDRLEALAMELRHDGWRALRVDTTHRHVVAERGDVRVTAYVDPTSIDLTVQPR